MRLAANMAMQRAFFTFEFIPPGACGKVEFQDTAMTEPWVVEEFNPRTHARVVVLGVAPRVIKFGSSEGVGFEGCTQLLEGEVETRVVLRKGAARR